jgi:hypothetical protein
MSWAPLPGAHRIQLINTTSVAPHNSLILRGNFGSWHPAAKRPESYMKGYFDSGPVRASTAEMTSNNSSSMELWRNR